MKLRHRGGGNYSTAAATTAKGGGGQTRRFAGLEWDGGGLDEFDAQNGGTVTLTYEGACLDFKVYDSPLLQALGRVQDGLLRSRADLQFRLEHDGLSPRELLEWRNPDTTSERRAALEQLRLTAPGRKESLEDKRSYVDHYFAIANSGKYAHDLTKLEFARAYADLVKGGKDWMLAPREKGFSDPELGLNFVNRTENDAYRQARESAATLKSNEITQFHADLAQGYYNWTLAEAANGFPGGIGPGEIYMLSTGVNPQTGKKGHCRGLSQSGG